MSDFFPKPTFSWHAGFLLLLIVAFSSTLATLQAVYLVLAFAVVFVRFDAFHTATTLERGLIGTLLLTVAVLLPLSALRSPAAVAHFLVTVASVGAAFVMTRSRELYLEASRLSLLLVQGGVFAYLFVVGFANFPLEGMILESSSNGITSYMIILQANFSAFNFILRRRGTPLTAILTLIICIVGWGRGSILAAMAILVINLLSYISWRSHFSGIVRLVIGLTAVLAVTLAFIDDIGLYLEANTKLGGGLYDEARERIITEYFNKLDLLTLFSGADYGGTSIETDFRGNPHNSFIRGHHVFGLLYLLALMLFPLSLLFVRQALSVKLFCAGMLLVVLFRASTEPVLFPTIFDFYFFAFCFGLTYRADFQGARPGPEGVHG